MAWIALALISGLIIGFRSGWKSAHITVARECEKLGAFYVGKKVYKCHKIMDFDKK